MADGMLEVLSPPTLGTSANNGDDSSFELCAIAFFFLKDMDKEVRENGVGIRSLIAAWSRAGRHTTRLTPRSAKLLVLRRTCRKHADS